MGQIVRRRKKGRPSKADLARRAAADVPPPARDLRRSLRRRNLRYNIDYDDYADEEDENEEEEEDDDEEEDDEDERRREKKLKLVLKLPPHDGGSVDGGGGGTRSEASGRHAPRLECAFSASSSENKPLKKRRIGGCGDGDGDGDDDEDKDVNDEEDDEDDEERVPNGDAKGPDSVPGTPSDPSSGVPLPDKKSLELILDKLQKKDTYGVYAEPVDPEELPDYHDIIEHPMDFATVRKKLSNGSYSTLEQFESDVFLICSNAMQYNAPETIYYKQARSIQELATKRFQRLRIEIERSEKELKSEQKTRSSSTAKKQIKKPIFRTAQEPVGSDFSSGATLATAGETQNGLTTTQVACEKPNNVDGLVEGNSSLIDTNLEKAEELLLGRSLPSKFGRKQFVLDENRATYNLSNQPVVRPESIFSTFEGENKQLVAVGLHAEYSYARSLARFAATLGPVAWKVASKRIEQALPSGFKFGCGWVGEYEPLPTPVLMLESRVQREPAFVTRLHSAVERRKDEKNSKASVPAKEHVVNCPTLEGKLSFVGSAGSKPSATVGASCKQQNLPSRNLLESENKVSKQVELNRPPSANQKTADLVVEKQPLSSGPDMAQSRSMEAVLKSKNKLQAAPFKQPDTNGVFAGGPNGQVMNNSFDRSRTISSPSDSIPHQMARAATYFPHGQEQGFSDPAQVTKVLAEKAQQLQKSFNNSAVDAAPVMPSTPSLRRDDSINAAAAAARAWMSIGAVGYRPATENSSVQRNQISADSLYNPAREVHPQTLRPQAEFPVSWGMPFQYEKNNFPPQAFLPQPIRMSNEMQFQKTPIVFPPFATADLSRFQVHSPWRGLSGPHTQSRQKQETLAPDLNIGFQPSGSPVRQSSGVLVDSQQPDLALQL
ncbi:uncharacterized protein LOC131163940 [Malania oleifera]|uniref:uncharacterized protein LOC131163940 n=1 Tax=Malania oleifera TaxID=397392 RepID=UPI0025AE449D|nr:uncharacterized protein LOC131163940 [Malania oleifera]